MRASSTGPRSVRRRKSSSRNRGSLASACTPPPPTVEGRLLTSPVSRRSPSSATAPVGPRLERRIGSEEVATVQGDLVVGEVAQRLVRRGQVEQVVATLLEDDDGPSGGGEDLGGRGAARARADDDHVAVGHPPSRAGGKSGVRELDPPPTALVPVAPVGRVAVGGLDGVAVQHTVVAGLELARRADAPVHLPQRRRSAAPRRDAPMARARASPPGRPRSRGGSASSAVRRPSTYSTAPSSVDPGTWASSAAAMRSRSGPSKHRPAGPWFSIVVTGWRG